MGIHLRRIILLLPGAVPPECSVSPPLLGRRKSLSRSRRRVLRCGSLRLLPSRPTIFGNRIRGVAADSHHPSQEAVSRSCVVWGLKECALWPFSFDISEETRPARIRGHTPLCSLPA